MDKIRVIDAINNSDLDYIELYNNRVVRKLN